MSTKSETTRTWLERMNSDPSLAAFVSAEIVRAGIAFGDRP